MFVAWTTLDDQEIAEQLAFEAVTENLAVCVHVDLTPIVSVYRWEGETRTAREYRVPSSAWSRTSTRWSPGC